jgi:beta-glucosidase/6-phospho-beta-glucosidase/beta-galactosidase
MRIEYFGLAAALMLVACGAGERQGDEMTRGFPSTFMFGAATAGFQVDMGCPTLPAAECVDANSDWYAWTTSPTITSAPDMFMSGESPAVVGPGHWELFERDFDLLKNEIKGNAYRMSLEWSRIFPRATDGIDGYDALKAVANAAALARYHQMFAALKARGLRPLVTLHHYTMPTWIHDGVGCHVSLRDCTRRGWLDRERIVREIAKYAGFVAREFGGEVDLWATLNEPFAVVLAGFIQPSKDRTNPPGLFLHLTEAKQAFWAMVEAHARMVDAVRANDTVDADGDGRATRVGVVYAMSPVRPLSPEKPADVSAAKNLFYLYNEVFLNAVAKGEVDADWNGRRVRRADFEGRLDWLGINYYGGTAVEGLGASPVPGMSPLFTANPFSIRVFEENPNGLVEMIRVGAALGVPVMITENGIRDPNDDGTGPRSIAMHLAAVERAIGEGLPVEGYFYWSLMDNFEWNHGMAMKFGLFAIDPTDPTKRRVARKGVATFRDIAVAREVPDAIRTLYGIPR